MSGFRHPDLPREQQLLYGRKLDDAVPPDHRVRHIDLILRSEALAGTFKKFEQAYDLSWGRPPYHPRFMAALYLYGMLNGIRSSRQLEAACHNRIDVRWLMEEQCPDHSKIAGFVKKHADDLALLLRDIVMVGRRAGLVKLDLVAVDGTKIEANAGKASVKTRDALARELEGINAKLTQLEEEWKRNEDAEAALLDEVQWIAHEGEMKDRQKSFQRERDKVQKALEAISRREEKRTRKNAKVAKVASTTDPDSRRMEGKDGQVRPNYNAQIAVDAASGMIVAQAVNDDAEDSGQLKPMTDQVAENAGEAPQAVVADSGYNSGKDLADLEDDDITTYVADPRQPRSGFSEETRDAMQAVAQDRPLTKEELKALPRDNKGRFKNYAFHFDRGKNAFRCPAGHWMAYSSKSKEQAKHGFVMRYTYRLKDKCATCPLASQCCKNPSQGRSVTRDEFEEQRQRLRTRMLTKEGKKKYRRRAPLVEGTFSLLKSARGLRRFLRRGQRATGIEFALECGAVNLSILAKNWGDVRLVLGKTIAK